jgi:hypothetical protein
MAGQFFSAIDDELTGAAVPVATAAAPASDASLVFGGEPAAPGRTFAGKVATAAPAGDVQTLLVGAVGGAVLTLIGVLIGYRLGRHR